jgi:hypothetical protein
MIFNLQKFLIENRLTKRASLNEDAMTKTDAEQEAMGAEEGDEEMFGDEEGDTWYKDDDIGSSDEFEKEPTGKDIKASEPQSKGLTKKQVDLKALEDQKDALLMQLKSGQLSLDQYKAAIGNIPAKIKKLRADIEKETNPVIGDTDEEEI